MRNFTHGITKFIEGMGLDPAAVSQEDLLDLGVNYYERLPGQRGHYVSIEELTEKDIDPIWLAPTITLSDDL